MDSPFSSQPSQSNLVQIFVHEDGSSLQIFAEAGGIIGRPLLMRKLRGHGAIICNDPKSAEIILVNQHTDQGRHFIRDWGADESKVVLQYPWVNKSIHEGRALLEEDDWGDCIAEDDGGPIGAEDDEDEVSKSPLPTPRITPTERKGSTPKVPAPVQQSFGPPSKRKIKSPPIASVSSASTSSMNVDMTPSMNGMSQPMTPLNPMMAISPAQFPVQMAAMMNPAMMNPAMMNPMLMQQMFAAMMMNQPGVQYNEDFKLALGDIMGLPQGSQMQPPAYSQPRNPTPVEEQALPFPAVPSASSHPARRSVSAFAGSPPARSMDKKGKQRAASPPTKRRKVSAPSYPETSHATSSNLKSSVPQTVDPEQSIFVKYQRPLAFFIQIDLHNRSSVVNAIKKHGGKIEKDMDLADYVVLYPANKKSKTFNDLLKSAQLSGKTAVPSKYVHDCVEQGELLRAVDYEFETVVPGKRKRQPSAVVESESEHESAIERERKRLERNERQSQRRKELRQERAEEADKARARQSSSQATPQKKAEETVGAGPSSSQVKPQKKAEGQNGSTVKIPQSVITGRRTPPVPGEHTRQPWGSGYKFSVAETEFAINYAQILVERDHTISATALAGEIYKKLPHHTLRSWQTHFKKITQNDLDIWRRRATIAYRKAMRQAQPGPSAAGPPEPEPEPSAPEPEEPMDVQFSLSPIQVPNQVSQITADTNGTQDDSTLLDDLSPEERKLLEEDDLNVISTFFANADENEDEDTVWTKLTASHHCYSEPTWQKFYEKHFDEVQVRHAEIMESAT